jgi:hypothetical protein
VAVGEKLVDTRIHLSTVRPSTARRRCRKVTIDRQLARRGQLEPPKSSGAGVRAFACPAWLLEDLAALLKRRDLTAVDSEALVKVSGSRFASDPTEPSV